jgi:hypothetical protein
MFEHDGVPAMVTLTYPGEWQSVAPDAATCRGHVDKLKRRYLKAWGRPLVGVWKREFQRRGAPHYHILMVPPRGVVGRRKESFRDWLSRSWAEIVGHTDPVERANHLVAGTGVDYAEGMRARDPKRLAVYFSKHGVYSAKEYQNEAPGAWVAAGSVGRFWGVWGLEQGTQTVELLPDDALAVARTMRRWQRANGFRAETTVARRRVNVATGELRHSRECVEGDNPDCAGLCWRRRTHVRVGSRMRGARGFVVVNDGAAFASALARYLDTRHPATDQDECCGDD